jgi:hypothetical protein
MHSKVQASVYAVTKTAATFKPLRYVTKFASLGTLQAGLPDAGFGTDL